MKLAWHLLRTCRTPIEGSMLPCRAERTGHCLNAREAAAHRPCNNVDADSVGGCPEGSHCLAPLLPDGDQFFKLCFQPAHSGSSPAVPAQAKQGSRRLLPEQEPVGGRGATRQLHQVTGGAFVPAQAGQHRGHSNSSVSVYSHQRHRRRVYGEESQGAQQQAAELDAAAAHHRPHQEGLLGSAECPNYIAFVGTAGRLLQSVDVTNYSPKVSTCSAAASQVSAVTRRCCGCHAVALTMGRAPGPEHRPWAQAVQLCLDSGCCHMCLGSSWPTPVSRLLSTRVSPGCLFCAAVPGPAGVAACAGAASGLYLCCLSGPGADQHGPHLVFGRGGGTEGSI